MTFEEWWDGNGDSFSGCSIQEEIKWFANKAWSAAVSEMKEQENKKLERRHSSD